MEINIKELEKKCKIVWKILQFGAYLNSNFITLEILRLLIVNSETNSIKVAFQKIENLALGKCDNIKGKEGFYMENNLKVIIKEFFLKLYGIDEEKILIQKITEGINEVFPEIESNQDEKCKIARFYYKNAEKVIEENNIDSVMKINLLNKLGNANIYLYDNNKKGLFYFKAGLKLGKRLFDNNNVIIAQSLYKIGLVYFNLINKKKELKYFLKALKMREIIYKDYHLEIAKSLNSVGVAYCDNQEYKISLDYFLKGLKMRKVLFKGDNSEIAQSMFYVGMAYGLISQYKLAIRYSYESFEMRQALLDNNGMIESLDELFSNFRQVNELRKEIEIYFKFLECKKSNLTVRNLIKNNIEFVFQKLSKKMKKEFENKKNEI